MSDLTPIVVFRENVNDDSVCITKWLVAERSRVEIGQPIAEVETSKVNMEISAPASGFLRYACREGEDVEIGRVLGYICDEVESDLAGTSQVVDNTGKAKGSVQVVPKKGSVLQRTESRGDRPKQEKKRDVIATSQALRPIETREPSTRFSKQALELIKQWDLDASQFENMGLVRSQDVLKHIGEEMARRKEFKSKFAQGDDLPVGPVPAVGVTFRTEKLPRNKRLEAKYLWSAQQNTLPSAVTVRCSTDGLHAAAEKATGVRADATALIIFEVARLLRKYPAFNGYYAKGCANYYDKVNIGFALDAGRGLMVPVIRDADKKGVAEIAKEMRELLVQYLSGELSISSLTGGTFTITDLSNEGVYTFHPLINQGQSAILAVCSEFHLTENQDGLFNLVLVFDHQLSEGRTAARFLNELQQRLEGGNGKKRAKQSDQGPRSYRENFAPPRTVTEGKLAEIWGEVFGLERVGVHDSFLELGGHSLLAARLLFRVQEAFQVEIPLRSLFETATVAGLAVTIEQRKGRPSKDLSSSSIVPAPDHRYQLFPLSDIQLAYLIGRSEDVELGKKCCQIYTEVDVLDWDHQRFEAALQRLIERHEMLRCVVLPEGSQQILPHVSRYEVASIDLREQEPTAAAAQLEAVRRQMSQEMHPTDRWPLFDFRVSNLVSGFTRLHVRIDLLIADGRSLEILFAELAQLYRNPDMILPPLEVSFRDYLSAAASLEHTQAFRESQEYWLKRLPELPPSPELPLVAKPGSVVGSIFVRRHAKVDERVWRILKEKSAANNLTPAGILLAAYAEVLAIWSKNPHFTINVTLFNRLHLHPQVNDIVGDFTSVNLLEVDNSKLEAFASRARRLQAQLWQDLDYRFFNGIRVMRELTRLQGVGPKAVMPVVFTSLLNIADGNEGAIWAGQLGKTAYAISQTPQVYLDFIVHEEKGALIINWDAVNDLFPAGLLDDLFSAYQSLLQQLASDDSSWHRTFGENARSLVPSPQIAARAEVNDTKALLSDELLHNLFLKQVGERPNQTAICGPGRRLSYAELYWHACRVEEELVGRGVKPNQLVAVVMEKGWEQVVAVLGIQFAGGAYLPIDPELPAERQRYLIEHGRVEILLTQSTVQRRLGFPPGVEVLAVDLMKPSSAGASVPRRRQEPEDLAYVIYTSGSTGIPKGVMIDHRGAVNTVLDINRRFGISSQDRVLALSRLSFDLSVYDIFGLLAAGGTIIMPAAELAHDAAHWTQLVGSEKVTVWNSVPALVQLLLEQITQGEVIGQCLRLVMMSGDWIPVNLPGDIRQILPNAKIVSLGGATEASIWSIVYPIEKVDPNWKSIPYGKPMVNQSFHVLNRMLAPCPIWVPGHLYIGGIGLAKGYWRDPEKTDASFIPDPETGGRLYRTGDLGRYLPDGNIEFLGREDFQVKVQGNRIELGEIEVRLLEHQGVENCVVAVREDNPREKRLVGYVIAKSGVQLEATGLREYLRAKLPEYMVPTAFVFLDAFPLTSNGKVDRKTLPAPASTSVHGAGSPTAPRDQLELQLTKLWERVLGVRPIGLRDNFFDLGGHSLMAVRLFTELRKLNGRNLPLSALFQAPTVEKLAELLRRDGWSPQWSSLVPIQQDGSKPPFYCVHGAGGNVLLFRDLARHLGPDYPFYGLQAQGLDGSKNYLRCVEDMASHYLKEIQELQPQGPYFLGGFCMGGQVAFEMAHRLRRDGQQVALLAMIDTYNFNGVRLNLSFREGVTHVGQKIAFHSVNLLQLSLTEQFAYLKKKLKGACQRESERFVVTVSNLLKRGPFGNGRKTFEVFLEHLNEEATFAYVPDVYSDRITIFRPRRHYVHLRDPQMGWGEMAANGVEIIELPVNPGGIFLEPYVQTLAEKLRNCIDEAQARAMSGKVELTESNMAYDVR